MMKFTYYYPNRPVLIPADPDHPMDPQRGPLDSLEASGQYIAEQKWNGDNCLIYTGEHNGCLELAFWNRNKAILKYKASTEVVGELKQFPKDSIINCELVNSRTKETKELLIVHCIMAWDGELLTGATWSDSRQLIQDHVQSGDHVVASPVYQSGYWDLFQTKHGVLQDRIIEDPDLIEGIILKDPNGKLVFSATPIKDISWMMKIRHASVRADGTMKKYAF
jgi:hypothetical protein